MSGWLIAVGLAVTPANLPSVKHLQPTVERFIVAVQSGAVLNKEDFLKPMGTKGAQALGILKGCAVNRALKSPAVANQVNVRWTCRRRGERPRSWYTLLSFSEMKISSVELAEVDR